MRLQRQLVTAFVLGSAAIVGGCGGEDELVAPPPALVDTWDATALVIGGIDVYAQGMRFVITLTAENEYFSTVNGDVAGFCDVGTDCNDDGDYSATATSVTLDPGTPDAVTLSYVISGSTLALSGTVDGETFAATLEAI